METRETHIGIIEGVVVMRVVETREGALKDLPSAWWYKIQFRDASVAAGADVFSKLNALIQADDGACHQEFMRRQVLERKLREGR